VTNPVTLEKRYVTKLNAKALSLMAGMLKMEPEERFTALDCLASPYFDGMREPEIEKLIQHN
jgi:cyclin-dependent kinase-like